MTGKHEYSEGNRNKETRESEIKENSLDEIFFGIGEDKQNNLPLSYYENFYYYNGSKKIK